VIGYILIKQGKAKAHQVCMTSALCTSSLFLISYLIYHYNVGSTKFTGQGIVRNIYFAVLISHTVLAVVIVPLIIATFYRAWTDQLAKHMKVAKITLPLWLYVSVTGVIVYLMLYHLYPSR
ncbi:MAG: DUF420 domain-containing protein, partial [Blastocatellia bacterium]|nr:DUF420 domain-containing protein [Blastocatellia bacterium]